MEHTLALIGLAHQGDKEARDTVFEENTGLIYSVAKRFLGRGVEMEDLFQIGSIGLLKAVDKFDTEFDGQSWSGVWEGSLTWRSLPAQSAWLRKSLP